ncbi:MAG TPA: lysylphosphatidylglycerol synthase transmembrane domain-containing protein [Dehalococcoidia bacterium]|nr:lysylphosphatidylglycerol synthase transmembrane domain-containing protein [Dehalococcoidia bacterium]
MTEPARGPRSLVRGPWSRDRVRLWLRLLIGLAVSLVSLVVVFQGTDLDDVRSTLGRTNPIWLAPAVIALAITIIVKAARWGLLFRPHYRPGLRPLTSGILIGQMVNNALPVRLGEVARIQYLAEATGVPRTYSLGTIALEKALDSVSLLGLFIVVVPFALLPEWVRRSGLLATAGLAVVLIGAILVVRRRATLRALADWLVGRVPALSRITESRRVVTILRSLDVLGDAGLLVRALAYSALALVAGAVLNATVLLALGLDLASLVPASLFVLLLGYLGGAVPASPGRIGIFQAVTVLSLAPFAIGRTDALSFSLILYAIAIVLPTLAGVIVVLASPRFKVSGPPADD